MIPECTSGGQSGLGKGMEPMKSKLPSVFSTWEIGLNPAGEL